MNNYSQNSWLCSWRFLKGSKVKTKFFATTIIPWWWKGAFSLAVAVQRVMRVSYFFEIAVLFSDSDRLVLNVLVLRMRNKSVFLAVSFAEIWMRTERGIREGFTPGGNYPAGASKELPFSYPLGRKCRERCLYAQSTLCYYVTSGPPRPQPLVRSRSQLNV